MRYIKGFDTLRALGMFFVLKEHNGVWFDDTVPNGRFIKDVLLPDGGLSLHLFFVLSSFLITTILLNEKARTDVPLWLVIRDFFARRTLRIFPIYYLLLFFLLAVNYPGIWDAAVYYLTYTGNIYCYQHDTWTNFSHTWSLCVEEQFYLLWGLLLLFVPTERIPYILWAAIACGIISTWYVMAHLGHMALLVWNNLDAFGIGALYAFAKRTETGALRFRKCIRIAAPIALCVYFYWKIAIFMGLHAVYGIFLIKTVNSILSAWMIMAVADCRSVSINKYLLENRALNFIGKISYGIYLYHYVYNVSLHDRISHSIDKATAGLSFHRFITPGHTMYWIHFIIVILIATASYLFIEKPILQWKYHFNRANGIDMR